MDSRRMHDPDELAAKLNGMGASILVVEVDFVFEEVFEAVPSLRFVGVCRAATNHVDVEAATAKGVAVVNTPGRNAQAVAEHALGLMLALARRIPESHNYVTGGRWLNPLGAVRRAAGAGAVRQDAWHRWSRRYRSAAGGDGGSAIGMRCIAHDPYVEKPPPGVLLRELDELLAGSDVVSIHAPMNAETEGLIDARGLALMKPTAFLMNLSDAKIVDRDALTAALQAKTIAGAALDVFETHPIAPDHPLLALDNVVLTPHLGGATEETIGRYSRMMAGDIVRFLDGVQTREPHQPRCLGRTVSGEPVRCSGGRGVDTDSMLRVRLERWCGRAALRRLDLPRPRCDVALCPGAGRGQRLDVDGSPRRRVLWGTAGWWRAALRPSRSQASARGSCSWIGMDASSTRART